MMKTKGSSGQLLHFFSRESPATLQNQDPLSLILEASRWPTCRGWMILFLASDNNATGVQLPVLPRNLSAQT